MQASSSEGIRKERESLYLLVTEKSMTEKELKFRQMQRNLLEDYLKKKDFSKPVDFSSLGEEYLKLKAECEAYGKFKKVREIIAVGKMDLKNIQKALRNPDKIQKK